MFYVYTVNFTLISFLITPSQYYLLTILIKKCLSFVNSTVSYFRKALRHKIRNTKFIVLSFVAYCFIIIIKLSNLGKLFEQYIF